MKSYKSAALCLTSQSLKMNYIHSKPPRQPRQCYETKFNKHLLTHLTADTHTRHGYNLSTHEILKLTIALGQPASSERIDECNELRLRGLTVYKKDISRRRGERRSTD